jgi:signal transduction histidine kinase
VASGALPLIEVRTVVTAYASSGMPDFWLVFPFEVIPLILTAWQYNFRVVLWYVGGLGLLEAAYLTIGSFISPMHAFYGWASLAGRAAILVLIGHIVTTLMEKQREQRQQLREANRQLVRYASTLEQLAVSRERNRLARELHDTLAHTLSALTVQLDASTAVWDQAPQRAREMVQHALDTARSGLGETRRALASLRAAPLVDLGLALALQSLADNIAERRGLDVKTEIATGLESLPAEVEQTYYRVAQEALDNVVRHAGASETTLRLQRDNNALVLEVRDDGRGMSPERDGDRYGLQGMRERAELIGATLEVASTPEAGTTVRLVKELGR